MNNRMPKILTSPTKNAREVVNPILMAVTGHGGTASTAFLLARKRNCMAKTWIIMHASCDVREDTKVVKGSQSNCPCGYTFFCVQRA